MHMQTLALHGKIENTSIIRHLSSKYHIMRISKHGHFRIFMRPLCTIKSDTKIKSIPIKAKIN